MDEWKKYKLSEVLNLISGGTPKTSVPEYWNGDIPWLSVSDFNTGRKYVYNAEKSITQFGLEKSSTNILKKGQIIISARGTVGIISMIGKEMAFNQSNYGIDAKEGITTNQFLYYSLKNIVPVFLSNSYGAVFNTITKTTFDHINIKLPPLPEQRAIASVLSCLDNKIDLLHRQNKTLEQMAETLFRQWFVENPDRENWEEGVLGDLFTLQRGFDLPRQKRIDGIYPIYAASGNSGGHSEFKVKATGVTTGRSGVLGKVFYVMEDFWPLNTSLFVKEFKISTPLHAYFLLKTIDLLSFNAGSAVPTLNRNHLHEYPVAIPPRELIYKFEKVIAPNFQKINKNKQQIRTLEKLRDTLLPKLMSGEVGVRMEN